MPEGPWFVVAEIEGREGVYGVTEVSPHSILAELAGQNVFLVSPWNDVAIDVAAKLNGPGPRDFDAQDTVNLHSEGGDQT